MSKTHPRTKPTQITRTFPGTEPPSCYRDVLIEPDGSKEAFGYFAHHEDRWRRCIANGTVPCTVRRWAELPTFPKQKGKKR